MKNIIQSLRIYVILTLLLGLVYPLVITLISQILLPYQANGSLILKDSSVVGSKLIGQSFTNLKYFEGRPSANNYNGQNSGGTNLGPSSKKLMDSMLRKILKVRQENGLNSNTSIPADMVLSSASGLDPHISLENALLQVKRISKIRAIPVNELEKMINENTDSDFIGIWGQSGVNVLALNIKLDEFSKKRSVK